MTATTSLMGAHFQFHLALCRVLEFVTKLDWGGRFMWLTLERGGARMYHLQSTASAALAFPSLVIWWDSTIPSGPTKSYWQAERQAYRVSVVKTLDKHKMYHGGYFLHEYNWKIVPKLSLTSFSYRLLTCLKHLCVSKVLLPFMTSQRDGFLSDELLKTGASQTSKGFGEKVTFA